MKMILGGVLRHISTDGRWRATGADEREEVTRYHFIWYDKQHIWYVSVTSGKILQSDWLISVQ